MNDPENKEKVVGILGGMGPEATVDLMQRIVRLTPAEDDSDHIHCIVDNDPKVPSRIKAIIEGDGTDPGPYMADMGRRLETFGADFLAIACNTAHTYYEYVAEAVQIPVIHLIRLVADHVRSACPGIRKVGILASTAIQITGLYADAFSPYKTEIVYPDRKHQDELFRIIRAIKTGDTGARIVDKQSEICRNLKERGAEIAVIACTELSVLQGTLPLEAIDAAEILAREIISIAKNEKQLHNDSA